MNNFIPRLCQCLLLLWLLTVICLFYFASQRPNASTLLTSDLKTLSPQLFPQTVARELVDKLSSTIDNRMILLLYADNEAAVLDSAAWLQQQLTQQRFLQVVDTAAVFATLQPLLARYRFNLLTPTQFQLLQQATDAELRQRAQQQLFGLQNAPRLLPITSDPFNWFAEYLLQALAATQMGQVDAVYTDAAGHYFLPVIIDITGQALQLEYQAEIVNWLQATEQQLALAYPAVTLYRSGVFFFAADTAIKAAQDIQFISIISIGGTLFLLVLAFASFIPLLLPALSIGLGIGMALLFSYSLFGSVHMLTILFGASLIGVVVDYSLHYFYHHASILHTPLQQRKLYTALLFSLVTSVIGYSALAFSELVSLQRVAVFSCIGLITAWLTVIALGDIIIRKPIRVRQHTIGALAQYLQRFLQRWITPHLRGIAIGIIFCSLLTLLVGVKHADQPQVFFSPAAELLAQERKIAELLLDYEPGKFILVRAGEIEQVFQSIAGLQSRLGEGSPQLAGIHNWLPSPAQQQQYYNAQQRLYRPAGLAAEFLQGIGVAATNIQALQTEYQQTQQQLLLPQAFVTALGTAIPPVWLSTATEHYALLRIPKGQDLAKLAAAVQADRQLLLLDFAATAKQALQEQRRSAASLLLLAYLLIAAILYWRYREISALRLLLIPAAASCCTLILLTLFGVALSLFHYMALFLVLGLGMDYVIFATDMTDNATERQLTLQAILLSALTSLLSFGLLSFSSLAAVSHFGMVLLLGNGFNLILTLAYNLDTP